MSAEGSFRASPADFLRGNTVSLTMAKGMSDRSNPELVAFFRFFAQRIAEFTRHWFKLTRDAGRTKEGRAAYSLTPAIEKYWADNPEKVTEIIRAFIDAKYVKNSKTYTAQNDALTGKKTGERDAEAEAVEIRALEATISAIGVEGDEEYIMSAYVDYKPGAVGSDIEGNVGHTSITQSRETEGFNPDFVFTATMNGCAFATTQTPEEATAGTFTAWHFQSTSTNLSASSTFRRTKNPSDWYGEDEYDKGDHGGGLFEVTNLLYRGRDNQWNVVSQQNDTRPDDAGYLLHRGTDTRLLQIGRPTEAARVTKLIGIFKSMQSNQKRATLIETGKLLARKNDLSERGKVQVEYVVKTISVLLNDNEEVLASARDMGSLNAAITTLERNRTAHDALFTKLATELDAQLTKDNTAENGKWLKNKTRLDAIMSVSGNIPMAEAAFKKTIWIAKLREEVDALVAATVPLASAS